MPLSVQLRESTDVLRGDGGLDGVSLEVGLQEQSEGLLRIIFGSEGVN